MAVSRSCLRLPLAGISPAERLPADPLAFDEVEDLAARPGHGAGEPAPRAAEIGGRSGELDVL